MVIKKCKQCGCEFSSKPSSNRKFCCHKCSSEYVKTHKKERDLTKLVLVECVMCHKQEYVTPSRAKSYLTCSIECLGKYNSQKYSRKIKLQCPICGDVYECQQSKISHHRTCGKPECRKKWLQETRTGINNSNYRKVEVSLKEQSVNGKSHDKSKTEYLHIVKSILGLPNVKSIPKGYVIHHKDANHLNNNPKNLVVLPKAAHRLIHTWFGNVLINALHTGRIDRETFFAVCTEEAKEFYKEIIDLNIERQVVLKQGELLESPEVGNQQPSIYRNIIEGSTTNSRVLADNAEDSNANTSALPISDNGDDIV